MFVHCHGNTRKEGVDIRDTKQMFIQRARISQWDKCCQYSKCIARRLEMDFVLEQKLAGRYIPSRYETTIVIWERIPFAFRISVGKRRAAISI